jgi:hypothetical protein
MSVVVGDGLTRLCLECVEAPAGFRCFRFGVTGYGGHPSELVRAKRQAKKNSSK